MYVSQSGNSRVHHINLSDLIYTWYELHECIVNDTFLNLDITLKLISIDIKILHNKDGSGSKLDSRKRTEVNVESKS